MCVLLVSYNVLVNGVIFCVRSLLCACLCLNEFAV